MYIYFLINIIQNYNPVNFSICILKNNVVDALIWCLSFTIRLYGLGIFYKILEYFLVVMASMYILLIYIRHC